MTDLSAAFAGIKEAQEETPAVRPGAAQKATKAKPEPTAEQIDLEDVTGKPIQPKPKAAKKTAWTRGTGKSSNPDYGRFTVYVPSKLRKQAERKWEDATGKDASDLVEHLLTKYLGA